MAPARLENWRESEGLASGTRLSKEPSLPEKLLIILRVVFALLLEYLKYTPQFLAFFYKSLVKPKPKDIRDKIVLVTGAGNGLGKQLSIILANEGAKLACVDIDENAVERVVGDINILYGFKTAKAFKADVSSAEDIKRLKNDVIKHFGRVDILVNNAGVIPLIGLFEGTEDDIRRIIDINLMSQFWTARAFVPDMQARGEGHVVAISSLCAAYYGCYRSMTPYTVSKCGVSALTAFISAEAPSVKTTTILPMTIATRKSIVEHVKNPLPPLTPEQVADATLDAILREYEVITLPANMLPVIHFFGMFPSIFRRPFDNVFRPDIV